eukprot:m.24455 g.24455  ORF g.24455 m.24455 type:complete len:352 (+) comp4277_c0_seq2:75-1130(+)
MSLAAHLMTLRLQRLANPVKVAKHNACNSFARKMRYNMAARQGAAASCIVAIVEDLSHCLLQSVFVNLCPLVLLAVLPAGDLRLVGEGLLKLGDGKQKRVFARHELGVTRPLGRNRRQAHAHGFHKRATPALAVRREHKCICCCIQPGIVLQCNFRHPDHARPLSLWHIEQLEELGQLGLDNSSRAAPQVQHDVFVVRKLAQKSTNEWLPALALLPFEHRQKRKFAFTPWQKLWLGLGSSRIKASRVYRLGDNYNFLPLDAVGNKATGAPLTWYPNLIHFVAAGRPGARNGRGLKHGSPYAIIKALCYMMAVKVCIISAGIVLCEEDGRARCGPCVAVAGPQLAQHSSIFW